MSSVDNPTEYRALSIFFINLGGRKLSLVISLRCFAKREFSEIFKNTLNLRTLTT